METFGAPGLPEEPPFDNVIVSPETPPPEGPQSSGPPGPRWKSRADNYHPNFQWMREHIGDELVRGITETILLRPEDPIEYLGQWLAQQARNIELDKNLVEERRIIQAEFEEQRQGAEERVRLAQENLEKEQKRKEGILRTQEEAKAKLEAEQRAKELEAIRAERTENRAPLTFGVPETIPEVPSVNVISDSEDT